MAINIDVPPVDDEQEALALMFHHLKLAAAYFEATPNTFDIPEHFSAAPMRAWAEAMEALYTEMEAA
jgi:hypothetical protein